MESVKKELNILKKINTLPNELVSLIQSYIPDKVTIFLTREVYLKNHQQIRSFIPKHKYEDYIRYLIRRDNIFVFAILLMENYLTWIRIKDYLYNNDIYINYIYFTYYYALEHKSVKIYSYLGIIFKGNTSKNKFKKKIVRSLINY
jgi:hypothetical protein